jgi:hypothetical protein
MTHNYNNIVYLFLSKHFDRLANKLPTTAFLVTTSVAMIPLIEGVSSIDVSIMFGFRVCVVASS